MQRGPSSHPSVRPPWILNGGSREKFVMNLTQRRWHGAISLMGSCVSFPGALAPASCPSFLISCHGPLAGLPGSRPARGSLSMLCSDAPRGPVKSRFHRVLSSPFASGLRAFSCLVHPPEPSAADPWNCRHGSSVLFLWAFALVLTLWNELPALPQLAAADFSLETKIQILKEAFPELPGGLVPLCSELP